ncbi:MAG: molybdenum cofactor biosynthesis protein MoaB [Planctomycetota bacterium]|nr:molybdenum cofactor biosynthesis protein MoaB [Planctomycetota bacterium]MCZ6690102.1 molybdenum cofactor biosynthesis protein MoaB [Planctomycetota bacterium]
MALEEHKAKAPKSVGCMIVTVSDSRNRESDQSGDLLCSLLETGPHRVVDRSIARNNPLDIESAIVRGMQNADAQAIILIGGTGISARDNTTDVVEEYLDKSLDGFGEFFRYLSYEEIGPAAMLSRAVAGLAGGKILLCIPGSPKAVELAMKKLILPELGHMVREATKGIKDADTSPGA